MIESSGRINQDGSTTFSVKYTLTVLDHIDSVEVFNKVLEKICDMIIKEHSAEIISNINFATVGNMASIELGKIAAEEMRKIWKEKENAQSANTEPSEN